MRIAQVSPLFESVPPKLYGGTERVIAYLTAELLRQGHDVTLFASSDSKTDAELVSVSGCSMRLAETSIIDHLAPHLLLIEEVDRRARGGEFDIVHFHLDYLHFPVSRRSQYVHVTTMHGRLDIPDIYPLHREFQDMPLVSISDSQRQPLTFSNWRGTVYHGLPPELYRFSPKSASYLAFLGRISPEKRVDRAIEIARRTGRKLRIAAKIDPADKLYFESEVEPLLHAPHVEFIGEIGEDDKPAFLGGADALLFPIDWPEPFGLVMIEAMACGTPVIAYDRGSVREIIDDGMTGYVVHSLDEAIEAVCKLDGIRRETCRNTFIDRFSVARMTNDYLEIYRDLTDQGQVAFLSEMKVPKLSENLPYG